jgi:hypothetical protein
MAKWAKNCGFNKYIKQKNTEHSIWLYNISNNKKALVWAANKKRHWTIQWNLSKPVTIFKWIEPLLRGHLSYNATFPWSQMWPFNTGT